MFESGSLEISRLDYGGGDLGMILGCCRKTLIIRNKNFHQKIWHIVFWRYFGWFLGSGGFCQGSLVSDPPQVVQDGVGSG